MTICRHVARMQSGNLRRHGPGFHPGYEKPPYQRMIER